MVHQKSLKSQKSFVEIAKLAKIPNRGLRLTCCFDISAIDEETKTGHYSTKKLIYYLIPVM